MVVIHMEPYKRLGFKPSIPSLIQKFINVGLFFPNKGLFCSSQVWSDSSLVWSGQIDAILIFKVPRLFELNALQLLITQLLPIVDVTWGSKLMYLKIWWHILHPGKSDFATYTVLFMITLPVGPGLQCSASTALRITYPQLMMQGYSSSVCRNCNDAVQIDSLLQRNPLFSTIYIIFNIQAQLWVNKSEHLSILDAPGVGPR